MKFFVDSADSHHSGIGRHRHGRWGDDQPVTGRQIGAYFQELVAEICDMVDGPVSAEVTALEAEAMLKEADELLAIADNVCIKVPLTWDGLKATRALADKGKMVNVTLCFSANQALLAAKAGAAFISPLLDGLTISALTAWA